MSFHLISPAGEMLFFFFFFKLTIHVLEPDVTEAIESQLTLDVLGVGAGPRVSFWLWRGFRADNYKGMNDTHLMNCFRIPLGNSLTQTHTPTYPPHSV